MHSLGLNITLPLMPEFITNGFIVSSKSLYFFPINVVCGFAAKCGFYFSLFEMANQ
jgi:hypothetical protein